MFYVYSCWRSDTEHTDGRTKRICYPVIELLPPKAQLVIDHVKRPRFQFGNLSWNTLCTTIRKLEYYLDVRHTSVAIHEKPKPKTHELCQVYGTTSGEFFGHERLRSQCFQVHSVTCRDSWVFFMNLEYIPHVLIKGSVTLRKFWISTFKFKALICNQRLFLHAINFSQSFCRGLPSTQTWWRIQMSG